MRTVTLLSSIIIAEAIRPNYTNALSDVFLAFTSTIFIISMVMDVIEFFKKMEDQI